MVVPGRGEPDAGQMQARAQNVAAEDPEAKERRFEEERDQAFHGQRGTEDVADEPGVGRPVHAELELLHDAGNDAEREDDQHDAAPEAGRAVPDRAGRSAALAVGQRLHRRHERGQPDGQRHDQEVVDGGRGELPSGKRFGVHAHTSRWSCQTGAARQIQPRRAAPARLGSSHPIDAGPKSRSRSRRAVRKSIMNRRMQATSLCDAAMSQGADGRDLRPRACGPTTPRRAGRPFVGLQATRSASRSALRISRSSRRAWRLANERCAAGLPRQSTRPGPAMVGGRELSDGRADLPAAQSHCCASRLPVETSSRACSAIGAPAPGCRWSTRCSTGSSGHRDADIIYVTGSRPRRSGPRRQRVPRGDVLRDLPRDLAGRRRADASCASSRRPAASPATSASRRPAASTRAASSATRSPMPAVPRSTTRT